MSNIFNLTEKELEIYFKEKENKPYRAKQIYEFLYKKRIYNIESMSNISKNAKELIKENFKFDFIKIIKKQEDKNVKKYLFQLQDNNYIESVLMYHNYGISICVSSQVGCNMNCRFCQSGKLKKIRNLETYEIIQQILLVENDIKERISHVVIMGIGEPFDNYENIKKFIEIINSPHGIDIGARHITVSTCGLIEGINKFKTDFPQVNLAISLHAPNNELRNKLMPINKIHNIESLINTLKEYEKTTKRRITFEYIMLENINDTEKCAKELVNLVKNLNCYINLIPYNETENIEYKRSKKVQILKFYDILKKNGVNVTIRKEFGTNLDAACGQLRANQMRR